MPSSRCCGTSVGVLVTDEADRILMIERGWYPVGIAPVAGHVNDEHTDPNDALVAEVREEVGLTVTHHEMVWQGWLPNLCASPPALMPGHDWELGEARVTGDLAPDPIETRGARWYSADERRALAHRTLAYARGEITDDEFADRPGLEPVWVELLVKVGRLPVSPKGLALVRRLYTTPPAEYWLDGRLMPAEKLARDRVTA